MQIKNKIYLETTTSTNAYLKQRTNEQEIMNLYYTFNQTNGYGRLNRDWLQNEESIAFSFLLKYNSTFLLNTLPLLFGLAICKTIHSLNINASIKWPNDIIINDKKVCGILVENKIINNDIYVICGIGLNINTTSFPDELKTKATSLKIEGNNTYNKEKLLDIIISSINQELHKFNNKDYSFINEVKTYNYLKDKEVLLTKTNELVIIKDINDDGSLKIERNNKIESYYGSEITLTNTYKN